jgi:hypothetical protein
VAVVDLVREEFVVVQARWDGWLQPMPLICALKVVKGVPGGGGVRQAGRRPSAYTCGPGNAWV